ncbi:heat shock protein transcriptional repressor HspR [Yimella sp. cx-51]|uniref:heat shock protein transcriptional repressor HspR n=1 Tax=Yimella sp. cx-51 TaxID=2770551 RepID=UPI00165DFC42|nr:helix-turn-helix transcriptional regulator [Yimella sp. cx-51]MBC9955688.1 helix-turn-helix transcriptional regulator [Yimella sp. cx-51]QTH37743.1 helix-turn-helix transcriptional regulator [Yimella sp. cx-51]
MPDPDSPVYVISVAAELAGMHAQTLRQYDRLGIVTPSRTRGGGRRYSYRDIQRLREVQRLSQEEGVSLAGISRIIELQNQVDRLRSRVADLQHQVQQSPHQPRVFAAGPDGQIVALRPGERARRQAPGRSLVVWRPPRQSRSS